MLEARYRHAVPKDAGETWFDVFPTDKPAKKAAKKAAKQTPARKPKLKAI